MVMLAYDENGNPTWFTGSVKIPATSSESDGSHTLTIDLMKSIGGACPSCPNQTPQTHNSGKQLILSFSSLGHGHVTIDGKQRPIKPFNFNYGKGVEKLEGTWAMNYQSPSIKVNIGGLNQIGGVL
ncbi:hypothetical protein TAO_1068 [Candidatus Nitrosoglobus terrae]|uniref:Uncharacterized protein n=2 Tax=Candidatus Nitrosoglobus terrae TaxID=1630141 RepID=A0A1Q2SMS0_9GAMM|nr:hypothetical protein TAO_1068 [Candidatus Nitrosoglobus terrae]